ncbi:PspC domain-containing protein [Pseudohalioglobus lutimaris]|uniref:PspC domain-containing protein n=1 Tax=Pseudohalioglobus lutimaris TaxID=1737061 RepID=A0A2N5WWU6_9GAMM|nr:PspC domain-containing protein [Pseudohalioglobus lutimaris]PLW66700.1 PspC domain-containing protein [Pseudohalioglobus lutimaris]
MSRRRKHEYRGTYRRESGRFRSNKRGGWGMGLYRNTRDGKIAGVCAGLADHWDIAHWVMRLVWIGGFLFTGTLALWVYLGAWILLAPRPTRRVADGSYADDEPEFEDIPVEMEYDERYHDYRPRKVFRYSESGSVRLERARERLDAALRRVENMESYVTSRRYNLNKEFSKL